MRTMLGDGDGELSYSQGNDYIHNIVNSDAQNETL